MVAGYLLLSGNEPDEDRNRFISEIDDAPSWRGVACSHHGATGLRGAWCTPSRAWRRAWRTRTSFCCRVRASSVSLRWRGGTLECTPRRRWMWRRPGGSVAGTPLREGGGCTLGGVEPRVLAGHNPCKVRAWWGTPWCGGRAAGRGGRNRPHSWSWWGCRFRSSDWDCRSFCIDLNGFWFGTSSSCKLALPAVFLGLAKILRRSPPWLHPGQRPDQQVATRLGARSLLSSRCTRARSWARRVVGEGGRWLLCRWSEDFLLELCLDLRRTGASWPPPWSHRCLAARRQSWAGSEESGGCFGPSADGSQWQPRRQPSRLLRSPACSPAVHGPVTCSQNFLLFFCWSRRLLCVFLCPNIQCGVHPLFRPRLRFQISLRCPGRAWWGGRGPPPRSPWQHRGCWACRRRRHTELCWKGKKSTLNLEEQFYRFKYIYCYQKSVTQRRIAQLKNNCYIFPITAAYFKLI